LLFNSNNQLEIFLFIKRIFFQAIFAVLFFNSSSFQKTNKSKSISTFFNISIETIESFHHQTGTNALLLISNSILVNFVSELFIKLNNHLTFKLFLYKNSPNQLI
jgi:hypothetical protein